MMKILIAGDWRSKLHEEAIYHAFIKLGYCPIRFSWHQYFKPRINFEHLMLPLLKFQNKYIIGPAIGRLNRDLIELVNNEKPQLIFIYRGSHILKSTLKKLHEAAPNTTLVGYNNDDPFSPLYPKWKWRHFLDGIPEYDLMLSYRPQNIEDFKRAGAKRVKLLRSWFIPEINRPVKLSDDDKKKYQCDVVFIGHFENDGRLEYIKDIVRQGWKLNLFGHDYGWHDHILKSDILRQFYPMNTLWGEEYNKAICASKIALCFFSKLNRDTYTRRCFEIPAAGTLLLSEYSEDLSLIFDEDKEAVYFNNIKQFRDKLKIYLKNDLLREQVSESGRKKVNAAGHDVTSRMRGLIDYLKEQGLIV